MTDQTDILTRLRVLSHHAKKIAENESLHNLHREAFTRCEDLTWQAANEIKRLRAERDEARHGEAVASATLQGWIEERTTLRAERDEARRCACATALPSNYKEWESQQIDAAMQLIAQQQGWDCFKEETK